MGLAIQQSLANRNPTNPSLQAAVAILCSKLGFLEDGQSDAERRAYLDQGRAIRLKLKTEVTLPEERRAWFDKLVAETSTR
jgi:hypothetical protein